jgi:SAM-dependent methyltransferase
MNLGRNIRLYSRLLYYTVTNPGPRQYRAQWDNFWGSIERTGAGGDVLWDIVPERAVAEDFARMREYMVPSLPLIDVGCGNGRQTRFLAQQGGRVIGVDVSANAVSLASSESRDINNVGFRVLDVTKPDQAAALHTEIGDVNIYIRGVVHAIQKQDRPAVERSLATLLGEKGTLYQIELSTEALTYFRTLPGDSPSGLPRLLHRVVRFGIRPVGFNLIDRASLFPDSRWSLLASGEDITINTVTLSHGEEGHVPASFVIVRPRTPDLK